MSTMNRRHPHPRWRAASPPEASGGEERRWGNFPVDDDELSQRRNCNRAASYLSSWIKHNSFRVDGGSDSRGSRVAGPEKRQTQKQHRQRHHQPSPPPTPSIVSTKLGNIASRLPWHGDHGRLGIYTGYVNDRMQPHGCGALVYDDGSAETSVWEKGVPVGFWQPGMKETIQEVQVRSKDEGGGRARGETVQEAQIRSASNSRSNSNSRIKSRSSSGKKNADRSNRKREDPPAAKSQHPSSFVTDVGESGTLNSVENETRDAAAEEKGGWRESSPETSCAPTGNATFLPHLDIGDVGSAHDMFERSSLRLVSELRLHDFAFVLRSDGSTWTYAIVAEVGNDVLRFVVDGGGDMKVLRRGRWESHVRLVRTNPVCIDGEEEVGGNTKRKGEMNR